MDTYPEYSLVSLAMPLDGKDWDDVPRHLDAGDVGTVVDVLGGGKAYVVEFLLAPGAGSVPPKYTMLTIAREKLTPAQ